MHAQDTPAPSAIRTSEDRKFCRGEVAINASIRAVGGLKTRVNVLDISATGFRMECLTYMSNSHLIFLTMPGFHQMEASVAWQTEWMYGCQFTRPLHVAVLDHIVTTYPALAASHLSLRA
jgi:hypothetical protein